MLKRSIIFISLCLLTSSDVLGGGGSSSLSISAQVYDHYRDQVHQVPKTETVCNQVSVPIQSNSSGNNSGAILLGAIVGNALGAASGVEHGRTLGTVIGGVAGNQIGSSNRSAQVDHYRLEQRCHQVTTYETHTQRAYSHSTIVFYHQGQRRELTFRR